MKKSIKALCLSLVLVFIFSIFAGCATGSSGSPDSTNKTKKDTLTVAVNAEPPSLGTCDHDSLSAIYINLLTYNFLYKIDHKTLKPVPDLAESYTIDNSGVEWTFKLRQGVKFHDGSELTADDVVASINNAKKFPGSIVYTGSMAKVEAVDKYTVKITTAGPYANLLYDLGYHYNFILPKKLIESGHDFKTKPIGTGPYKLVEWSFGNQLILEKNKDYFNKDEMPSINKIVWRIIPEGTSRTIALQAGEVDLVYQVETADIKKLKEDKNIGLAEIKSVDNYFLSFNKKVAPFNDVNLRKAVNSAIDRDAIIKGALNGYAVPSISSVPMGYWGSWDKNAEGYDMEKAKKYMAAWGGDPSTIKMSILCSTEERVRIATIIQSSLAQIGITVKIESMDYATMMKRRAEGNYATLISSWSPSNILTYVQRYHSDTAKSDPGAVGTPEVDALVKKAASTIDENARLEIIHQIVEKENDLIPQAYLYQPILFRAYNANLDGIEASATGYMALHKAFWK